MVTLYVLTSSTLLKKIRAIIDVLSKFFCMVHNQSLKKV